MVVCSTHTAKHCSKGVNIPEAWLHSMAGGLSVTAGDTDRHTALIQVCVGLISGNHLMEVGSTLWRQVMQLYSTHTRSKSGLG